MMGTRYDTIGHGYAEHRREDPDIRERIHRALGDARTVINVGAGTGSYEPDDRYVVPVEPSDVMAEQRPTGRAPAVRSTAGSLPFRDDSFDAAMAVLTLHHWDDELERGVREMRRVSRGPVAVLTLDAAVSTGWWLFRDYFPGIAELDRKNFPDLGLVEQWLGGDTRVETVPLSRDTPDGMLVAFWAHPERVLDPAARAATSGFARMPEHVLRNGLDALSRDLTDGTWDAAHGELCDLAACDVGLRLVTSTAD